MGTNVHRKMQKLRHTFPEDGYSWFQIHNKLGVNAYGRVVGGAVGLLNRFLKRGDLQTVDSFPRGSEYNKMSFEEKMRFSAHLDRGIYALLEKIYRDYVE